MGLKTKPEVKEAGFMEIQRWIYERQEKWRGGGNAWGIMILKLKKEGREWIRKGMIEKASKQPCVPLSERNLRSKIA